LADRFKLSSAGVIKGEGMHPTGDRLKIIQAVERIRRDLGGIDAGRRLSTSQTIALYIWLLDFESLKKFEPIDTLQRTLISCLEPQIITTQDLAAMIEICRKFLDDEKNQSPDRGRPEILTF
jgi:hypothetical protein